MTPPATRLRALAARVHGRVVVPCRGAALDFRLAWRLLVKHFGLTVVGTVAMAFAMWSGIIAFEFYTQVLRPTLPLAGGDRMVGIVMLDTASGSEVAPTLHDFTAWSGALKSVPDLAAFRSRDLNVIVGNNAAEPVEVAEISAAAFRVAQAQPLLGRSLVEADEKPGAPWVVVIGHDDWRTRFGSDPEVIGRELRLGNVHHTVVGVMPEGFRFPVAHGFWVPFRLDPVNYARRQSPGCGCLAGWRRGHARNRAAGASRPRRRRCRRVSRYPRASKASDRALRRFGFRFLFGRQDPGVFFSTCWVSRSCFSSAATSRC